MPILIFELNKPFGLIHGQTKKPPAACATAALPCGPHTASGTSKGSSFWVCALPSLHPPPDSYIPKASANEPATTKSDARGAARDERAEQGDADGAVPVLRIGAGGEAGAAGGGGPARVAGGPRQGRRGRAEEVTARSTHPTPRKPTLPAAQD